MDNEQARFLLSSARPNGADANDPRIADATAQSRRDPDLARWLAEERSFDVSVAHKLQANPPPATLRARLLAGTRASEKPRHSTPAGWWIGVAAAIALLAAGAVWWRVASDPARPEVAAVPPLLEWQENCLAIFADPNFALDLMNGDYPTVEKHLREQGTHVLPALPFARGSVGLLGCKVLAWRDQPVSFLCFKATTGELVHLFVLPRGTADESLFASAAPHRSAVGAFATISWIQGNDVAMVASPMPAAQLDGIIARTVAQRSQGPAHVATR